ncbi:putative pinene synthase [Capsicum baccatum]|uniref:Pinene synthase n=1 Tax=Capsicum baccatum TaxID=33114 RepID=A0A2G2VEW3_CAPBA|nr:putative pinene synthase [Capsicum baccatum]
MNTHYEDWISEVDGNDLHAIALCFRLLRQQGYYVSCDAFRRFTDDQGDFKKELVNDVHGMLSLYEAAQFRVHGEEIMDEALTFTITQLKLILPKLSNSQLAEQISICFEPQYRDARKILTKVLYFTSIMDDTYDTYGTLDELTLLMDAIERWNIDASEPLPSYMKIIYGDLLNTYNEIEKELANENKIISNRLFQRGVELYNKPRIFYHKEGYFVVLFVNIEDRNEVIYSSPYTMNNRPMIVKSWAADFTFHEERWTSINHPKSITVQGPCGRILEQQVDYDWTPLYRNTCLMIGYVCPIRGQRNIEAKQVEPTQKEQPPRQRNYPKRDKRRKTIQNQCAQKLDELMTISL